MEEILDNFDQLCFDHNLITIKNKILNNERLGFKEAEIIMETRDLNSLGVLAKYKKFLKDGRKIYFVVNRHINPTNICAISCKFCAFGKTKKSSDAYEMNMDQILSLLDEELKEIQGDPLNIGGYYEPNNLLADAAMRPNSTLNSILQ